MKERLMNCWLSGLALTVIVIRTVAVMPRLDYSYFIIYGIALMSLVASLFKSAFIKWNRLTCNESFSVFTVNLFIILSSVISTLFAFVLW